MLLPRGTPATGSVVTTLPGNHRMTCLQLAAHEVAEVVQNKLISSSLSVFSYGIEFF